MVIRAAEAGEVLIVTSSLTIAEVVKLKRATPIPRESAELVRAFFRRSYIIIRELDRFLAERAQEVVWDYGVEPKDAVHVATALATEVVQLDTFDARLIAKSGTIGSPPLRIGRPFVPEQLAAFDVTTGQDDGDMVDEIAGENKDAAA
jgi:predicted nucleic acid-binding protein